MGSHLSPAPSRSTGSAPTSRRDPSGSIGSNSSRPSVFSASRTGSSGHSLSHSGSIPSDVRKRGQAISPAISAVGGYSGRSDEPPLSPLLISPPMAHFGHERAGAHRGMGPGSGSTSPEPMSPTNSTMQFTNAPWAGGLDSNWTPT